MSVAGGFAVIKGSRPGVTSEARLGTAGNLDVDVSATWTVSSVPDGGGIHFGLLARGVADFRNYAFKVVLRRTEAPLLVIEKSGAEPVASVALDTFSITPEEKLRIRAQVVGTDPTTLRVKIWKLPEPEPNGWQLTKEDASPAFQRAGDVGFWLYVSASASTASAAATMLTVDDFVARAIR